MTATATAKRAGRTQPITWRWISHEPRENFACGFSATLAIQGDDRDSDVSDLDHYDVECRVENGRVKGWTVQKLRQDGEVVRYCLPGNLSRCQCPHSAYRPNGRPCRHRQALHGALTEAGFTLPPLEG